MSGEHPPAEFCETPWSQRWHEECLDRHVRDPLAAAGIIGQDQDLLQALFGKGPCPRATGSAGLPAARSPQLDRRGSIAVGGPRPQLELVGLAWPSRPASWRTPG